MNITLALIRMVYSMEKTSFVLAMPRSWGEFQHGSSYVSSKCQEQMAFRSSEEINKESK